MTNRDTQVAWHYHNGTKHPGGFLMDPWHSYDPEDRPLLFKKYIGLEPIPLPLDTAPLGVPALAAISTNVLSPGEAQIPDLNTLSRVFYFSAGITKRIKYPWGAMPFRAAACTGALYHIELYLVCGNLPGLPAGVYHFDPDEQALRRLRQGDYRQVLIEATADEPAIARAPAILVYTDVFWRNAVKYQAREYRHAFWDSGTILANTLAMASAHNLPVRVVAGFVDESVNRLLDLDTRREAALVLAPLGYAPSIAPDRSNDLSRSSLGPLNLKVMPVSVPEREFRSITAMHEASFLTEVVEVAAWRADPPQRVMPPPSGQLVPLQPYSESEMSQDPIEEIIARRGSTRKFSRERITFRQLSTALDRTMRGIPVDFLPSEGATLNQAYLIVNAVEGLSPGAYVFDRGRQALELLKEGDFRNMVGALGLHQELPADASVDIFFLADLKPILERSGNRGYRAAQLEASITAGKLYLAAYAMGLGATGLTFFDDAVTDFFSPQARGKSVMFLIALGRKKRRV